MGKTIASALKIKSSQFAITVNEYPHPAQVIEQVSASNDATNVGIVIPAGASQMLINDLQQNVTPKNLVRVYTLPNTNDLRITVVQTLVNKVVQSQLAGSAGSARWIRSVIKWATTVLKRPLILPLLVR